MGYTHYWRHDPISPEELQAISEDAKAIILASELPIRGWDGTDEPELTAERLSFNGDRDRDEDHETFSLSPDAIDFDFCKTARKPYDVVVTAVLLATKDRLKDGIHLSSDGDPGDWQAGYDLAVRALDRPLSPFQPEA